MRTGFLRRARARRGLVTLTASLAAVGAAAFALRRSEPAAVAQMPPALPSATIAVVATPHDADARASAVRFVAIDAKGVIVEKTLASIAHAPGAVVRGDILRGRRVVVIAADDERAGDPQRDFASTLWRVDDSGARAIARGLYHASRPLASIDGAVYVERGQAGAWPTAEESKAGALRIDPLEIDAINPETGASRTVYTSNGHTLHLAGEHGAELIVYRVDPRGADLLAIDRATGRSRLVTTLPPFARDFSIDEARSAVVMSNRDDKDAHLWVVARVDLASGAMTRLATERDDAPAPFALPGGAIAWTASGRRGLGITSPASPSSASSSPATPGGMRLLAPLGAGFDAVTNADAAWITILHVPSGDRVYDAFAAVHVASGTSVRLTTRGERVEVLGFLGGANGGAR